MKQCSGITRDGARCARSADGPNGLCWLHDPSRSEDRKRAASKAGKGAKPNKEIQDIKGRLSDLADGVLLGTHDRADAAVAGQLLNYVIRALGMELKIKETEELERRLEELESLLEAQQQRGSYGRGA